VLKSAVQWHPSKIPDLIATLKKLVSCQFVDADRALAGRGEFALKPEYARHRVTAEEWRRMTEPQRAKARDACSTLPSHAGQVTSTDGSLTVRSAPSGGRKPLQRKRPAADKTTTPKRRRK